MLGSGMELMLRPGDYLYGGAIMNFVIEHIVETRRENGTDWVILLGMERPNATQCWRARRVQVRIASLRQALTLLG